MEATICLVHGPIDCSRLIHNGFLVEYVKIEEMCQLCRQAVTSPAEVKKKYAKNKKRLYKAFMSSVAVMRDEEYRIARKENVEKVTIVG